MSVFFNEVGMKKTFTCFSDKQWQTILNLMEWKPPPIRGVPRADFRKIWNSIFCWFQGLIA